MCFSNTATFRCLYLWTGPKNLSRKSGCEIYFSVKCNRRKREKVAAQALKSEVCVCLCTSVHGGARFARSGTEDEIYSKCQAEMSVAKLLQRAESIRGVRLLHMLGVILTTTLRLSTFQSLSFYLEALFLYF